MLPMTDAPDLRIDFDAGAALVHRNEVAFPGDTGDRFSLTRLDGRGPAAALRLDAVWSRGDGSEWRLLLAPFRTQGTGSLAGPVSFDGQTFNAGQARHRYRFDSYRLTWRKLWKSGPNSTWMTGATLKVRDAEVGLSQGGTVGRTRNTGLVPLFHVFGREALGGPWSFEFQADALAAPQGRAIEAEFKFVRQASAGQEWYLAFRSLEGGADNDEVFSFAWFSSAALGIRWSF